jgi:hypothetical protein
MPVQKGKRRKRPRTRRGGADDFADESSTPMVQEPSPRAQTRRAKRWQFPPWLNLAIGLALLALGAIFALAPTKGIPPVLHVVALVGYLFIAALYLSTAFRQYRGS